MEKEIKINVPDGYEIDKENSTFECIKFKPVEKLPKTWEEYCKTHPRREGESWVSSLSDIYSIHTGNRTSEDRNLLPNRQYAEAMRALCQLIQLRDCYNDGWIPNWSGDSATKYCIEIHGDGIAISLYYETSRILAFKTMKLCEEFLNNFKNLIEVAKPLL